MALAACRAVFPQTRPVRSAAHELTTAAQGCRMAASVDGVLTSRGADLIIDDPLKPDEALLDTQRTHIRGMRLYAQTATPLR